MSKLTVIQVFTCLIALSVASAHSQPLELTLPTYSIQIDPTHLEELYDNPETNEYFPATFSFDDVQYSCEVRFRGGSARLLPKKSWRIKFDDSDNIFNAEKINLNAEYRDISLMRNFLALSLFHFFNYPAPETDYISFFVNGNYMGVFLQVEEIDEDFLSRIGKPIHTLYKAKTHGATMAPILNYDDYTPTWDKKIGPTSDYRDIQALFSELMYWSKQDFEQEISDRVDVQNFLEYCALEFTIVSHDCFTKNYYLYHNPATYQFEVFPWDNDTTFGNNWLGHYHPSFVYHYQNMTLNYHLLFQRIMENETWRADFWENVDAIRNQGFAYLHTRIDSTYLAIRNDVYQDTSKVAPNQLFDLEMDVLHTFLDQRSAFLQNLTYFERPSVLDFYVSNPFPTADNPDVTFRIMLAEPAPVRVEYIKDLDDNEWGAPYTTESLILYDDGNHNDGTANDLVYGNQLSLPPNRTGVIPFSFKIGDYYYPANDLFYINYISTTTLALNQTPMPSDLAENLVFGTPFRYANETLLPVINLWQDNIDLDLCAVQGASDAEMFSLPPAISLAPGDTLLIATNKELAEWLFPAQNTVGDLWFDGAIGDTIRLHSPARTPMISTVITDFIELPPQNFNIIINEINYHSADNFDPQDWIELYNPHTIAVDMSNWTLKDEDDNHSFVIPEATMLASGEYLVLCENEADFALHFPEVSNAIGDIDFGFSGGGDAVRLFDVSGAEVDHVVYDDDPPWPQQPDGNGPTLELIDPAAENNLAEYWTASENYGTPGAANSMLTAIDDPEASESTPLFHLSQNYPNPWFLSPAKGNPSTTITVSLPPDSGASKLAFTVRIYNTAGQHVKTLIAGEMTTGTHEVTWDGRNEQDQAVSSGIYFYRLQAGNFSQTRKMILLR